MTGNTTKENIPFDVEEVYGKITDEELEKLRNRIGKVYPINEPFVRDVNEDNIRRVARGIGDNNSMYTDREHAEKSRYGKLLAPLALYYGVAWGSWDLRHGQGLPGVHGLHSGDHWLFYRPLVEGDKVRGTKMMYSLEEKHGRWAGRQFLQKVQLKFYNQDDELVAEDIMPIIRGERTEGKARGKYSDIQPAKYTPEEIAQIDAEIAAEEVRGATPRYWEDVQIGDKVQPLVRGPLTVGDMIAWMMGIGSPHLRSGQYWLEYRKRSPKIAVPDPESGVLEPVERVHWDSFMAKEIGMPAAYDYGSQRGGWATHFMTNYVGDDGFVAEMEFQYRSMNFIHDVTRITGKVVNKWRGKKTGTGFVEVEFHSINQRGEDIMPGRAWAALPSKETGPLVFPIDIREERPDDLE